MVKSKDELAQMLRDLADKVASGDCRMGGIQFSGTDRSDGAFDVAAAYDHVHGASKQRVDIPAAAPGIVTR